MENCLALLREPLSIFGSPEVLSIFGSPETDLPGSWQSIKGVRSHSFDRGRQNVSHCLCRRYQ